MVGEWIEITLRLLRVPTPTASLTVYSGKVSYVVQDHWAVTYIGCFDLVSGSGC